MSAGVLTSNHVNYLIWRYLQESGHGEAAVKLQRDWISDPQSLPFAQHIKTHALVALVQKGLQFYDIEQSITQNGAQSSPSNSNWFFGPLSDRATSSPNADPSEEDNASASRIFPRTRKHGRESAANGSLLDLPNPAPAAKRSRRSIGTEATNGDGRGNDQMDYELTTNSHVNPHVNSVTSNRNGYSRTEEPTSQMTSPAGESQSQTAADGTGMDIDDEDDDDDDDNGDDENDASGPNPPHRNDNHNEQQEEQQQHDEPARMTLTLTNGASVGVQSDKVVALDPETITLTVPNKNVLHTAWNPRDAVLATAGDALCRIWTNEATRNSPNLNQPQYIDILDSADDAFVTAMAWAPDGNTLAVATRSPISEWTGVVSLWAKSGKAIDDLPAAHDMVLLFRWSPSGTYLLGITSSGRSTSALVIWDTRSAEVLPTFQLDHVVIDAAWCDDDRILVCGHEIVAQLDLDGKAITGFQKRHVDWDRWTILRYDPDTNITAFAAEESARLGIFDSAGVFHVTKAHDAEITALAFQPGIVDASYSLSACRLLVTSSLDGSIKVWDAKNPFSTIHVLSLGRSAPAMAISFTPDGFLMAAAGWNRILIWNAEAGGMPKASWKGEMGKWQGLPNGVDQDSGIGEEEEGSTHSLSWNSDGRKLAYGLGNQIAIISLRS